MNDLYTVKPPTNTPHGPLSPGPTQGIFSMFLTISWTKLVQFSFCKKLLKGWNALVTSSRPIGVFKGLQYKCWAPINNMRRIVSGGVKIKLIIWLSSIVRNSVKCHPDSWLVIMGRQQTGPLQFLSVLYCYCQVGQLQKCITEILYTFAFMRS